ncbi:MAG: hypothetical protein RLZZ15_2100 [Verrucomicrobiota bacterium]|jgi:hypothetical protein
MYLSSLIGQAEWGDLTAGYRERAARLWPTTATPARFGALWSDWELEALCRFALWPSNRAVAPRAYGVDGAGPSFRFNRLGEPVVPALYRASDEALRADVVQTLYGTGAAITLAPLHNYSNAVLAVTRGLEAAFRAPVRTHLFLTHGAGQALRPHTDPQDVLVLQLRGEKSWRIHPPDPETAAFAADTRVDKRDPAAATETILHTGGWLYLPKGLFHRVQNQAPVPSVHLSFTIHPMTWAKLLRESLENATEVSHALNARLPDEDLLARSPEEIGAQVRALLPFVDVAGQSARYYGKYARLGVPVPAAHLVPRAALDAADETTRFAWRTGEVTPGADHSELMLAYRREPLVLVRPLAPVIAALAAAGEFCPPDVALPTPAQRLLLCKFLASVGVLRLVAAGAPPP